MDGFTFESIILGPTIQSYGSVKDGFDFEPIYYFIGGNILTIVDAVSGPQTQTFTYDNLDRLTSAAATGGTDGLYNETYSYDPSTGNLATKGGLTLTYGSSANAHAATGLSNGNSYVYNAAGLTNTRVIGADTYTLGYNGELGLKVVNKNNAPYATFLYDGDGTRVQSTINGVTTKFVGEYYEVTGTTITKYYGGSAMRVAGSLYYLLSDHLGSNSLILDTAGNVVGETRYTAWGEERYSSGTVSTDYTYTGQYSNTDDFGLMYYKARWYDPQLGRFAQADSIVPGAGSSNILLTVNYNEADLINHLNTHNKQLTSRVNSTDNTNGTYFGITAFDRYSYVNNNPTNYLDDTGHFAIVLAIGGVVITLGVVEIVLIGAAVGLVLYNVLPGREERIEATAAALDAGTEQLVEGVKTASQSISDIFITYSYKGDPRTAGDIIGQEKKGIINREFPSELLGKTADEINKLARAGNKAAQTAQKLLNDKRFNKSEKKGGKFE